MSLRYNIWPLGAKSGKTGYETETGVPWVWQKVKRDWAQWEQLQCLLWQQAGGLYREWHSPSPSPRDRNNSQIPQPALLGAAGRSPFLCGVQPFQC